MKLWIWILIAYLAGSFFPVTRITALFGGLGKATGGGSATKAS